MTGLEDLVPSKAKAYVALVGAVLSFVVPFVLEVSDSLPAPWPAVIGALVAVLTALGVYEAPYVKPGTVVAPVEAVNAPVDGLPPATPDNPVQPYTPPDTGFFRNPWR